MLLSVSFLSATFVALARASQPGAAEAVAAPMRNLTWGQLNFLHTTDTHGWLGGHLLEAQYSGDWGDYVSFAEHLRKRADDDGVDLLLIDTGDRVEGNGIYDASTPKGLFTNDILRSQDIDLLSTGNHELYVASTARREHEQTVPMFRDSYITSNLDYIDPATGERVPQAPQRYKRFTTKNQKIDIVAFGFLFDFTGNAANTYVQPVALTLQEDWFQQVIGDDKKPDLFVVIGHVGLRMPEFRAIYAEIRRRNPDTPIAMFAGHAHVRDALRFDDRAFGMASGRYMETVGWMSIDGVKPSTAAASAAQTDVKFSRRYMDNNLYGYYFHTGLDKDTFLTSKGRQVRDMITRARKVLNLDYTFGCAPKDLWMTRAPYPHNDSIYTWLEKEVLPDIIVKEGREAVPRIVLMNTGGIRFDIFAGPFTHDSTFIVSPFTSVFRYIPAVPYKLAKELIRILNEQERILGTDLDTRLLTVPQQMFAPDVPDVQEHAWARLELRDAGDQKRLGGDSADKPALIEGYTTKDDIGENGDDSVRLPLTFYKVPNCFQAEIAFPEVGSPVTVDVVFPDFVQPWIVGILSSAGYSDKDVVAYRDETLTYLLGEWIKENWKLSC